MQESPEVATLRRRDFAAGVVAVVAATAALAVVLAAPGRAVVPGMGPVTIAVVAGVMVSCGTALGAMIRVLSGRTASVEQWLRRASAGVILLAPAAVYVTWPFLASGWDFDDCGSLIARNHLAFAYNPEFQKACEVAAPDRLLLAVIWAAIGCTAATAYGLWLRRRDRRVVYVPA